MQSLFDFDKIRRLISRNDFRLVFDGMNGVAGPYAQEIFIKLLKCPQDSLKRCIPLEDFGGEHPDPNLTYAPELV